MFDSNRAQTVNFQSKKMKMNCKIKLKYKMINYFLEKRN